MTMTLADGTVPGQCMSIVSLGSGQKVITLSTPLSADANQLLLGTAGQNALFMWNDSKWVVLSTNGVLA